MSNHTKQPTAAARSQRQNYQIKGRYSVYNRYGEVIARTKTAEAARFVVAELEQHLPEILRVRVGEPVLKFAL